MTEPSELKERVGTVGENSVENRVEHAIGNKRDIYVEATFHAGNDEEYAHRIYLKKGIDGRVASEDVYDAGIVLVDRVYDDVRYTQDTGLCASTYVERSIQQVKESL